MLLLIKYLVTAPMLILKSNLQRPVACVSSFVFITVSRLESRLRHYPDLGVILASAGQPGPHRFDP